MPEIKVTFDAADDYERVMGAWSRAAGACFLDWLAPAPGLAWLDVGCGTGAFSELVLKRHAPRSLAGVDPAPAQIEHARRQMPNADWRVADAMALPFDTDRFDIAVSALVLNFVPDPVKALGEMRRVLRNGGLVAGYLWERSARADFSPHTPMEQGLQRIGAEVLRPPMKPASSVDGANAALQSAGFSDTIVTTIEAPRTFRDFDDYWHVQTLPLSPLGKSIAALTDESRRMLRETMQATLMPAGDGSITYSARAVAFKARKQI